MRDNEFSNPGREYALSGREFSNPGREWASQPAETDRSGREYRQELIPVKPVKKKRRRSFRPAALTAAALVTASVVLGSASLSSPRAQYPVQELSAEHRAYLDAVWENMERSDLDELEVLARDPTLEDIVLNAVNPFLERVKREYNSADSLITINDGSQTYTFDLNDRNTVHYNGEALAINYKDPNRLFFIYEEHGEAPNRNIHALFDLTTNEYPRSTGSHISNFRTINLSFSGGSTHVWRNWQDYAVITRHSGAGQVHEPLGEWSKIITTRNDRPGANTGLVVTEERMKGECFWVTNSMDVASLTQVMACLYDGQVTFSYREKNGISLSGTVYVENGYTTGWDGDISMELADRPVLVPTLRANGHYSELPNLTRYFITPDSDDPLFAQFSAGFAYQGSVSADPEP